MKEKFNFMKYYTGKKEARQAKRKEKQHLYTKEELLFGDGLSGGAWHPWDALDICKCGCIAWLHGRKWDYESGTPYRAVCHRCFRHTHKGSYEDVVKEWNARHGVKKIRKIKGVVDTEEIERFEKDHPVLFKIIIMILPVLDIVLFRWLMKLHDGIIRLCMALWK